MNTIPKNAESKKNEHPPLHGADPLGPAGGCGYPFFFARVRSPRPTQLFVYIFADPI
jgi:hypothetical protein